MEGFEAFIAETGLIDLPMIGRRFTWYQPNGRAMSRLDRFLINEEWLVTWEGLKQWGLMRSISDHCPVLLKNKVKNWGPKPFRFFDAWLRHSEFKDKVAEVWRTKELQGTGGFILKEKLKATKVYLKKWSKEYNSELNKTIEECKEVILQIDVKGEAQTLTEEELEFKKKNEVDLWRRNEINYLEVGGTKLMEITDLKEGVMKYFQELFIEDDWERPIWEGIEFKKVTLEQNIMLTAQFTEEEIKEAVWDCDSSKAPGPDGCNFGFIKAMWEIVKDDVVKFVEDFHTSGRLVRGSNASFIVLIPKKENPMKKVMEGLISEQQSAFIQGRQLMDSVVVANETIDEIKKKKKKSFIFKIDFEKAYDKVSWNFIDYMLMRMGFDNVWRKWIMECLRSSTISVLLNGSVTKEFSVSKGLRQGDPLSPFLFLIAAEGLSKLLASAEKKDLFNGMTVGSKGLKISHLQFADDTIIFGEASKRNVKAIKSILRIFEMVSGLKINYNKSKLYGMNIEEEVYQHWAIFLNCKTGKLPMTYLGMPIGASLRSKDTWAELISKIGRKLAGWKNRFLSLGGHIVIINSVLTSLPVFLMSTYLLPDGVIKKIDAIRRKFLWGGCEERNKIAWVRWDKVCKDRKQGGMGIKDLRMFILALMGKWWARLVNEQGGLWRRVLLDKYGGEGGSWGEWITKGQNRGSRCWKDVCKINELIEGKRDWVKSGFKLVIGDGAKVSFWRQVWVGSHSLEVMFPRLSYLSTDRQSTVQQMGEWIGGSWRWRLKWRRRLSTREQDQETQLRSTIQNVQVRKDADDRWWWRYEKDGEYTVKSAYKMLTTTEEGDEIKCLKRCWNLTIPLKICAFNWLSVLGRTPCKVNLLKRNIIRQEADAKCSFCAEIAENEDHLLLWCDFSRKIWNKNLAWWEIKYVMARSCKDAFLQHSWAGRNQKGWQVIWYATIWALWSTRNRRIFEAKQVSTDEVFHMVQYNSYCWIKSKIEDWTYSFADWCNAPSRCRTVKVPKLRLEELEQGELI
ncbi:hypothetical protein SLEP1_g21339 [Rubroshorea leprosula]|uniref:Reverse transcriptase domain-containing protein n=1 Tax=Rubroshorea leprosula TaxID=152421 RepID=A0AAV5JB05_9ROSI|nr:hypothetical protein SLEP1_g21339 [Rubroshorea leprosula]